MRLKNIASNLHSMEGNGRILYYSYETCIAVFSEGKLLCTDKKYSKTTSKHMNIIKNEWCGKFAEVSQEELEQIIKEGV